MHNATHFEEKPLPLAQQREIAERAITGAQTFIPYATSTTVPLSLRVIQKPLVPTHSALPFQLLRGIFALSAKTASSSRRLCVFDDVSDTSKGGSVEYKGAPLVQADLSVLLGLIKTAAAMHRDRAVLTLNAVDFLHSIGKKNPCSRSVKALANSLASLRSATFVVKNYAGDRGCAFGFIDEASWAQDEGQAESIEEPLKRGWFRVKFSPKAAWAFENVGRTYVQFDKRCQLADGVETALADLIASTAADSYDVSDLAVLWGRGDAKELGREVREALGRLLDVGLVKEWSKTRGRVHVVR